VTPGLVSILVVNWNGARLLESCLASVHAQDYQPFELIVVDNGSVDGSAEIAAKDEAVHQIRLYVREEDRTEARRRLQAQGE